MKAAIFLDAESANHSFEGLCKNSLVASASSPPRMMSEPMFEVMMVMAFLKVMVRPWLSVTLPSSSIWSKMLDTYP